MSRLIPKIEVKRFTKKEAVKVMNEAASAYAAFLRGRDFNRSIALNADPRRDIIKECGHLENPTPQQYKEMWEGFGLAARIINLMPQACFSVDSDIYETERPRDTAFEKKVKALTEHPDIALMAECEKADTLSLLGEYGGMYLGFDDGADPKTIAPGLNEDGTPKPQRGRRRETELLYVTALDQTLLRIKDVVDDQGSRRAGLPKNYEMITGIPNNQKPVVVHWSRILHVAEVEGPGKVCAIPLLKRAFNPLLDIHKILGGSAEMFWKGGFPGIAATVDPRFIEAGVETNEAEVSEDMQKYLEGLQRSLIGVGYQFTQLSPGVADPTAHLMMQFQVIATTYNIPLRIFLGSEEAKLASGQDAKAWNNRVTRRQNNYVSKRIIRPLINRLIYAGVIPPPKGVDANGLPKYTIFWPDIAKPDQNEISTIADRRAAAMMKYITSGAYQVMQPSDFFVMLGYDPQEALTLLDNAKKKPELKIEQVNVKAADSGVDGKPPSDSPSGATK